MLPVPGRTEDTSGASRLGNDDDLRIIVRHQPVSVIKGTGWFAVPSRLGDDSKEHASGAEAAALLWRRGVSAAAEADASALLSAVRSHWGIENQLHWVMDVIFNEDHSRARADNAPLNLAVLRRIALNLAKANPAKTSIRGKLKRAGWDNSFLAALMLQMR